MLPGDPIKVVREAINAVPAVKYALGIAGVAASLALAAAFFSNTRAALFGVAAMLVLMTLLVIFAVLTKLAKQELRIPALVLTWTVLLVFVGSTILTFTSVFFSRPKPFSTLMQEVSGASIKETNGADTPIDSSAINIRVASARSGMVKSVQVSPRATVDHLTALAQRAFSLEDELPLGSTSLFKIRWVVVHDEAMDDWNRLSRVEQRQIYAMFLSDAKVRTASSGSVVLEAIGIQKDMTVNLVAIEDEDSSPPMNMPIIDDDL